MKINFPLNRDTMQWDAHKAFHWRVNQNAAAGSTWGHYPFTVFDTGEVIWSGSTRPAPAQRGFYSTLGLWVLSARDRDMPRAYHPETGDRLCRDWLVQGGNYFVIDPDTETAVSVGWDSVNKLDVPSRFQSVTRGYFAGEGRKPVGTSITYSKPGSSLDKTAWEHITTIRDQCKAFKAMADAAAGPDERPSWARYSRHYPPINPLKVLAVSSYTGLDEREINDLAEAGVSRVQHTIPFAKVKF